MMMLSPLVSRSPFLRLANNMVLTWVLLSVVYTVKDQKKYFVVGLVLGIPWVLSAWIYMVSSTLINPSVLPFISVAFFGYIILVILRHIIRTERVTADILYGAFSVYILLGLLFAAINTLMESVSPNPMFVYSGTGQPVEADGLYYFSFVTLTTLGYGDIVPVQLASRALAIIEAMIGVFYTGALVGRLVGLYVAQAGTPGEGPRGDAGNDTGGG
jgi:hypothetical protein